MRSTTITMTISVILSLFVFNKAKATTYTTINSGLWSDITNVWSTNGITPCGCFPGTTISGDTVIVNHNLSVPTNIIINSLSQLTVGLAGQMNGGFNINAWNCTIDIFGSINMTKYTQGVNSTVNMHPGAILIASNAFIIVAGVLNMNGALINSGGLGIQTAGTMNLTNASRFFVVSGNATVDGTLFLDFDCCMATNGNWKNSSSGSILGSGTVNSGGNINNSGFVDLTISWCAQGTGLGMPTPENCLLADLICNAIVLPVELTRFEAEIADKNLAEIKWETASEQNSSHFIIWKSTNGNDWRIVDNVSAAGNSQEVNEYKIYDEGLAMGTTYYKLELHDLNGRTTEYQPITLTQNNNLENVLVFPNPVAQGNSIHVKNLANSVTSFELIDINGRVIFTHEDLVTNNSYSLDLMDQNKGFYILRIVQENEEKSLKINIK